MKLPPSSEARALRAATPAEPEALAQLVRSGLTDWVRAMVSGATAELESSALRHAVAGDRSHTATALALLQGRRELVVDRLAHGIASRIDAAPPGRPTARVAADEAGELKLTLIDEAQIDEDIEIARIVQAIEAEADGELQQLAALASGLRGLPGIDFAALPLRPLACASGLRAGLVELAPDPGTRLLLLRQLGSAMGHELRRVARDLSNTLLGWGVQPAQYRVKHTAAPPAPTSNARRREDAVQPAASTAPPAVDASAALWRLVERARQTLAAETPLAAPTASANALPAADEALTLRLFADPLPAERTRAPLEPGAAAELMERLFAQIEQHLGTTPAARSLLSGLYAPGRALAAHEPQLWTSLDHPWWKLLDRLIAMGSVHGSTDEGADGPAAGAVTQSLGLVMRSLRQSPAPSRLTLQAAADEVQQLATRAMDERTSTLQGQLGDIQRQADRDEVEVELREQIVQQLRSSPVCPGLRQFLVGPWTQAMTAVTLQHGLHCAQMGGLALVVDDLIRATARPGQRVSRAQRAVLLRQVSEGLAHAGLPPSRNDAEMADLQALLENPPPVQEERWEDPVDSGPAPLVLELQAGLPTVPIAMGPGIDTTLEVAGHKPWLDELAPGAYCRLFLLGRWMTAQLTWVSDSHNLYLFSSRHGGRTHSLTRRMLGKLRAAGLATSVEDGALLAQAMDQLADTGFSAP